MAESPSNLEPRIEDVSILEWLRKNQMRTETGTLLDFKDHRFLLDFYRDWSPLIVSKKAGQIGFTTSAILKSFFAVGKFGLDSIYSLPTQDDMSVMVGGKVNRIISNNPCLQEMVADKNSIEQKKVGRNMIYYRGTWGEREAITHSSDLNVHDEASRSKSDVVELYETRQFHSKWRWRWVFSNPSVRGDLTDRCWEMSDKKEWFVVCGSCGYEQVLTWPESVSHETRQYVCLNCRTTITDEMRRMGFWKPTASGEWSGYHISLLMAPWVSAAKVCELGDPSTHDLEQFTNFVLGEPYCAAGNSITPEIFIRNLTDAINSQERVVIGCDSGNQKHYVCGNSEGLFYYGVTENWKSESKKPSDSIEALMRRWPDAILVVDAMPDITGPREMREMFPGRVFLNHYAKDRKKMQMIRWGEGDEYGSVLSDRNRMLQLVIDEFSDSRIPLQGTERDWRAFVAHWLTLYRVNDTDAQGNEWKRWLSSNSVDHFCHSCVLWRIGMNRFGFGGGDIIHGGIPDFSTGIRVNPQGESEQPFGEIIKV